MTEAEWQTCTDLPALLRCACSEFHANRTNRGRRLLRLFACAVGRSVWDLVPAPEGRAFVERCEQFADSPVRGTEVEDFVTPKGKGHEWWKELGHLRWVMRTTHGWRKNANTIAIAAVQVRRVAVRAYRAGQLPGTSATAVERQMKQRHADLFGNPFRAPAITEDTLRWNEGTVVKIAKGIYDEQAYERVPILADALEEAGCTDAEVLTHCRGSGPHVRGCWVVDRLRDPRRRA
jgi:hypothetical protein